MEDAELVEIVQDLNPWRRTGKVDLPGYVIERDIRERFERLWETGSVVGIVGLRRTGKTTFLKQRIAKLDELQRTCYFSFDLVEVDVKQVVEVFCERVLNEPVSGLEDTVYFFLDEVQNLENWSRQIKHFHDNYEDIRFVVTGSSAANVLKGAGESLAGRFSHLRMNPFSFREYLRYKGFEPPKIGLGRLELPQNSREWRVRFNSYIEEGGMPELYRQEDKKERLEEVVDLVFFRDIVELFEIKRPELLKGIFRIVAQNSGQKVNYTNISDSLDSDFRTVKDYIEYLAESFLITECKVFRDSEMSRQRKNPKVYAADHSYADLYNADKGLMAETVAFNHLKRLGDPVYIESPETDIVLPEKEFLFEIKFSDSISENTIAQVAENADRTGFKPVIVTEGLFETRNLDGTDIQLVPLHLIGLLDTEG